MFANFCEFHQISWKAFQFPYFSHPLNQHRGRIRDNDIPAWWFKWYQNNYSRKWEEQWSMALQVHFSRKLHDRTIRPKLLHWTWKKSILSANSLVTASCDHNHDHNFDYVFDQRNEYFGLKSKLIFPKVNRKQIRLPFLRALS